MMIDSATIRKIRIRPSLRIESRIGRTIRNRIESRSFAGPYLRVQLVVLVSAFMIQLITSLVCCFYTQGTPFPPICKSGGGTCPVCPVELAPVWETFLTFHLVITLIFLIIRNTRWRKKSDVHTKQSAEVPALGVQ